MVSNILERVAVTGSTGFLGRHLVKALRQRGYAPSLLEHSTLDLTDPSAVTEKLVEQRPSMVFHLAGTRGVGNPHVWSTCAELNVAATVHLLDAAQRVGVERIVIIGSADEYGNQPGPLSEDLDVKPTSPYAASKAAATRFAQAMFERDGCPVVILRPFTVYGPGQPSNMFVAEAVECAVNDEPFRMTEGRQRRDLVYVDDAIVAFIEAAVAPGIEGQIINVGSGKAHALREVAELVWQISGSRGELMIGARAAGNTELHDTWADVRRANELLGWSAEVSLEDGLTRTIEFAGAMRSLMSQSECVKD